MREDAEVARRADTQNVNEIEVLCDFENIVCKFGRYRPGQKSHYDPILGVNLISDNQYAIKIS